MKKGFSSPLNGKLGEEEKQETTHSGRKKVTKIHEEMLIRITKNNDLGNKEAKQFQTNKQLGSQIFNINIYLTLQ